MLSVCWSTDQLVILFHVTPRYSRANIQFDFVNERKVKNTYLIRQTTVTQHALQSVGGNKKTNKSKQHCVCTLFRTINHSPEWTLEKCARTTLFSDPSTTSARDVHYGPLSGCRGGATIVSCRKEITIKIFCCTIFFQNFHLISHRIKFCE